MTEGFWTALGLTFFAGLSTGAGAMAAFFTKTTDKNLLSFSLGLSSGVMIYVSFMELLPEWPSWHSVFSYWILKKTCSENRKASH